MVNFHWAWHFYASLGDLECISKSQYHQHWESSNRKLCCLFKLLPSQVHVMYDCYIMMKRALLVVFCHQLLSLRKSLEHCMMINSLKCLYVHSNFHDRWGMKTVYSKCDLFQRRLFFVSLLLFFCKLFAVISEILLSEAMTCTCVLQVTRTNHCAASVGLCAALQYQSEDDDTASSQMDYEGDSDMGEGDSVYWALSCAVRDYKTADGDLLSQLFCKLPSKKWGTRWEYNRCHWLLLCLQNVLI